MSKLKAIVVLGLISMVSACAKSPDAIPAVSMGDTYQDLSCSKASQLLTAERETLAALSIQQKNAAAGDAIGVFLLAIPVSSLSGGDKEGAISTSKGKINALEARRLTCK